jgi:hypothetical protein
MRSYTLLLIVCRTLLVRYAPAPREDAPNIARMPLYGQTNPPPPLITVPAPVAIPRLPLSYPMTKYPHRYREFRFSERGGKSPRRSSCAFEC